MPSVNRARWLAISACALLLGALLPSAAAAATRPIRFDVHLGQGCIAGRASDNVSMELIWRDASRALKGAATVQTGDFGHFFHCFGDDPDVFLESGDRIKGIVGSERRRFIIPVLTLNPDRVADVFRGKAPAGTRVHLEYATGLFTDFLIGENVQAGPNGTWSFEPGHDVIGGHYVAMRWRSAASHRVQLEAVAAFLTVTLDKPRFTGATRPGRDVEITIEDATMDPKATGVAVGSPQGRLAGRFRDGQGDAVPIASGDHLSAPKIASDADWIVPKVNGRADPSTEIVRGRCFDAGTSGELYRIWVISPNGNLRGVAVGDTEPSGRFEVDFSDPPGLFFDPANIRAGDRISIECLQETGDWVRRLFVA